MSTKFSMSSDKRPDLREEIVPPKLGPQQKLASRWDPDAPEPEVAPQEPVAEEVEKVEEADEAQVPAAAPPTVTLAKPATKKAETALPPGVLRWGEQSVAGNRGARIQQCIIYQIYVAQNPFWTRIINGGRGYLSKPEVIARLVGDTPEDFFWDEDGVIGWKRQRIDGEEHPVVSKYVRRKPKTEEERVRVREAFGVTPHTRKLLAKDDCPRCRGTGSYKYRPYPDNENLTANVECQCSWE